MTDISEMLEDFDAPMSMIETHLRKKTWPKKRSGGSKPKDVTNQRFGHLVAIRMLPKEEGDTGKGRSRHWECRCDCGKTHIVILKHLTSGNTRSCGCSRASERSSFRARFTRLIGGITPADRVWAIRLLEG
jgi:hypothetical protein